MIMDPYLAEFIGTATLLLFGAGVVANVNLKNTIAEGQNPWVLITAAWGFAVFVSVMLGFFRFRDGCFLVGNCWLL